MIKVLKTAHISQVETVYGNKIKVKVPKPQTRWQYQILQTTSPHYRVGERLGGLELLLAKRHGDIRVIEDRALTWPE